MCSIDNILAHITYTIVICVFDRDCSHLQLSLNQLPLIVNVPPSQRHPHRFHLYLVGLDSLATLSLSRLSRPYHVTNIVEASLELILNKKPSSFFICIKCVEQIPFAIKILYQCVFSIDTRIHEAFISIPGLLFPYEKVYALYAFLLVSNATTWWLFVIALLWPVLYNRSLWSRIFVALKLLIGQRSYAW